MNRFVLPFFISMAALVCHSSAFSSYNTGNADNFFSNGDLTEETNPAERSFSTRPQRQSDNTAHLQGGSATPVVNVTVSPNFHLGQNQGSAQSASATHQPMHLGYNHQVQASYPGQGGYPQSFYPGSYPGYGSGPGYGYGPGYSAPYGQLHPYPLNMGHGSTFPSVPSYAYPPQWNPSQGSPYGPFSTTPPQSSTQNDETERLAREIAELRIANQKLREEKITQESVETGKEVTSSLQALSVKAPLSTIFEIKHVFLSADQSYLDPAKVYGASFGDASEVYDYLQCKPVRISSTRDFIDRFCKQFGDMKIGVDFNKMNQDKRIDAILVLVGRTDLRRRAGPSSALLSENAFDAFVFNEKNNRVFATTNMNDLGYLKSQFDANYISKSKQRNHKDRFESYFYSGHVGCP